MRSIIIVLAVALWMILGYNIYGRFISKKLKINDKEKTPAYTNKNKTDYSPATKPFLIGHHFAAIAGAGPIIGPILAVSYFGWLPVVLWVSLGSVFIGAMHDYVTLIASVRNKAKGVSTIAKEQLGTKSSLVFGFMIWITLILIITVFSVSSAESIIQKPQIVLPILSISLLAPILAFGVKKLKWNYKIASIIALILVFAAIIIGNIYPIEIKIQDQNLLKNIWITIIMLYALIASLIPIEILMRPRDYISSLQMIATLTLGIIAIIIVNPVISAPLIIKNPVFSLWPILFITVACGAISGFHGLVSSGTTSKQLSKESHGKAVGYGGMLLEGSLAIIVTLVAVAAVKWGSNSGEFQDLLSNGWIVLFSSGFGNIVGQLGVPFITVAFASSLGALMVNQFILTSVDASARLSRYVLSENLFPKLKNKIFLTLITIIPAWILATTNSYETLWKLFGTSNQLIASISLITVSAFFNSKKIKTTFIKIPAMFVLLTTLSALLYLSFKTGGYLQSQNWALLIISAVMFLLGSIVAYEGLKRNKKHN